MNHLEVYLIVGALLFVLGLFAVISRRNAIAVLMGIELILNGANINFIAFAKFSSTNLDGHIFAIFVIILAAAEAAIALAIVLNIYNNLKTVNVDEAASMRG